MGKVDSKDFGHADSILEFEKGELRYLNVGSGLFARGCFQPGWRWSETLQERAGTPLCEDSHFGYVIAGEIELEFADGQRRTIQSGDAFAVDPGHDGWVVGDRAAEILYFYPPMERH